MPNVLHCGAALHCPCHAPTSQSVCMVRCRIHTPETLCWPKEACGSQHVVHLRLDGAVLVVVAGHLWEPCDLLVGLQEVRLKGVLVEA
eukprot:904280-Prorocentrum_lima.AAC.1